MAGLLTENQIAAGELALTNGKLNESQVSDLVSIFRGYLKDLADDYPIESTLLAQDDSVDQSRKCAKLAACLFLFQENQFTPTSGFAPTVANRTGFNYSADEEVYKFFEYAFCLFWTLPAEISNRGGNRYVSSQGAFIRRNP